MLLARRSRIRDDASCVAFGHLLFEQLLEGLRLADRDRDVVDGIRCSCIVFWRSLIVELLAVAVLEGVLVHQVVALTVPATSVSLDGVLRLCVERTELGRFSDVGGRDASSRLVRAAESTAVQVIELSWVLTFCTSGMATRLMLLLR